jgi:uncharacterized membrane protein YczE
MVGIGTVISAFAIGLCVQITFRIMHFDPTKTKHETFSVMFENIKKIKK